MQAAEGDLYIYIYIYIYYILYIYTKALVRCYRRFGGFAGFGLFSAPAAPAQNTAIYRTGTTLATLALEMAARACPGAAGGLGRAVPGLLWRRQCAQNGRFGLPWCRRCAQKG